MKKMILMTILLSITLVAPAFADRDRSERRERGQRIEQGLRHQVNHDRGPKYKRFKKRMHKLRKDLRHERRENRRLERRLDRVAERRAVRRAYRDWRRPYPVVNTRPYRSYFYPRIVLNIPLNW